MIKNLKSNNLSMENGKKEITKKLKEFVVPQIKRMGFSGTFPHFRRINNTMYEFLSFQFNRYGGSFIVEVGCIEKDDLPNTAQSLPFEKLNYSYTTNRLRIEPDGSTGDYWFSYANFDEEKQFENLAKLVESLLPQTETFFKN